VKRKLTVASELGGVDAGAETTRCAGKSRVRKAVRLPRRNISLVGVFPAPTACIYTCPTSANGTARASVAASEPYGTRL